MRIHAYQFFALLLSTTKINRVQLIMKSYCILWNMIQLIQFFPQCMTSQKSSLDTLCAYSPAIPPNNWNQHRHTPQQIDETKNNFRFKNCEHWGNWHSDHDPSGLLKPGVSAYKIPKRSRIDSRTFQQTMFLKITCDI